MRERVLLITKQDETYPEEKKSLLTLLIIGELAVELVARIDEMEVVRHIEIRSVRAVRRYRVCVVMRLNSDHTHTKRERIHKDGNCI
jgi:hypothetical protein